MLGTRRIPRLIFWVASVLLLSAPILHAEGRKVTKKTAPDYPILAIKMKVEGIVMLKASVTSDGRVESVTPVSGHILLKNAAAECVKQWEFEAASSKTTEIVAITFKMPN